MSIKQWADGTAEVRVSPGVAKMLTGEEDVDTWDEEELLRGRKRDSKGNFSGRTPSFVPRKVFDELVRRRLSWAEHKLAYSLEAAIDTYTDLLTGEDVDDSVRLRAADRIVDRVMGRVPERVAMTVEKEPWETTMDQLFIDRSRVMDAQSWEDDDASAQGSEG